MGIRFQKRGRNERLRVDDIHTAYAVSQKSAALDHLDDLEPIIKDSTSRAEETRKDALDQLE